MRFPAAIESTDPSGRLLGLVELIEKRPQNASETVSILAITDKCLKLKTKNFLFIWIPGVRDATHTIICKIKAQRVSGEQLSIFHFLRNPSSSVIGSAWY